MAYVSQEMKRELAPQIKAICKKYGIKATLAVRNHSTLVLNVKSGSIDFISNLNEVCGKNSWQVYRGFRPVTDGYISVNPYHLDSHYDGVALAFLQEVLAAMKGPKFFDESNPQIDYFHVSHYIDINVGQWDKPYELTR